MIRKFNICRAAFGSSAQSFRASVYDLNPKTFGTFDLVFFFGDDANCHQRRFLGSRPIFILSASRADQPRTNLTIPPALDSRTLPVASQCWHTRHFSRLRVCRRRHRLELCSARRQLRSHPARRLMRSKHPGHRVGKQLGMINRATAWNHQL